MVKISCVRSRSIAPLSAALLVIVAFACTRSTPGEMTLATRSVEARAKFLEARWQYENFHMWATLEFLEAALQLDPEFAMAHTYLGLAAPTAALRGVALERALQLSVSASAAEQLFIQAVVARARGNPKLAVKLMSKVSKLHPYDSRPSYFAGLYYYMDLDDLEMASEWLNRSRTNAPLFPPTLNTLGYLYMDTGDLGKAESVLREQLELLPDQPNPYNSIGDLFMKAGRHEEAVNYYARAVALDSTFVLAQRNIGINLVWGHRYEEGRKAMLKSIEMASIHRGKIAGWGAMVRSYLYERQHGAAVNACREAIRQAAELEYPGLQASYELLRSLISIGLTDYDQAEAALEAAQATVNAAKMPEYSRLSWERRILIGRTALAAGQKDYALANRQSALLLQSIQQADNPQLMALYHLAQGKIDLQQGKFVTAIHHLELTNMRSPYDVYHLALAYRRVGSDALSESLMKKVATWNRDSEPYALIRADAIRRANR